MGKVVVFGCRVNRVWRGSDWELWSLTPNAKRSAGLLGHGGPVALLPVDFVPWHPRLQGRDQPLLGLLRVEDILRCTPRV